jgi:hypothetical protein
MLGINVEYADATLRHLSTLGASGRHKQNIERDLKTYLGQPSVPKPFHANIHVKIQKPRPGQSQISSEQVAFLLPHQYFHYLYHKRRALFEQIMLGGTPQNVHDFWLGVVKRRDPRIRYHEMIKRKNWITKAIPISYHGDAVPCLSIGKAGRHKIFGCDLLAKPPGLWSIFLAGEELHKWHVRAEQCQASGHQHREGAW